MLPAVISVKERPDIAEEAIAYLQQSWPEVDSRIYENSVMHSLGSGLPHWFILVQGEEIVGCAGLINNDFISRQDLCPWIAAVHVSEGHRGHSFGRLLIDAAKDAARDDGFHAVYLTTDLEGFYEKYGFRYYAQGYHPWGEESRIYACDLS